MGSDNNRFQRPTPKFEDSEVPGFAQIPLREHDPVNSPSHYAINAGGRLVEVIDILEARFSQDALLWQVGKYLLRAGRKEKSKFLEDLKKARFYLDLRIKNLERDEEIENVFS